MIDADLLQYYVKEFYGYKRGVEGVNHVFALYNRRWAKNLEEGRLDVILSVASVRVFWSHQNKSSYSGY